LLPIIRRSDGTYGTAKDSFFPSEDTDHDEVLPRVDRTVYTSGKSKTQQQNAKTFLEEIGVREVGESEQVETLLEQRYTNTNFKLMKQDLKRFIALVDKDPTKASLFTSYFIFELKDGKWGMPKQEVHHERRRGHRGRRRKEQWPNSAVRVPGRVRVRQIIS